MPLTYKDFLIKKSRKGGLLIQLIHSALFFLGAKLLFNAFSPKTNLKLPVGKLTPVYTSQELHHGAWTKMQKNKYVYMLGEAAVP